METFDSLFVELDSIDRHLSRRKFLKIAVLAAAPLRLALDGGDREFLRKVAATLIPPEAVSRTGIDVIANVEHLLQFLAVGARRVFLPMLRPPKIERESDLKQVEKVNYSI